MPYQHLCLLGGTGFVGSHLLSRLARPGRHLRVVTHHPERHRHLQLIPGVTLVPAGTLDGKTLTRLLDCCDAAINLVGILNERGHDGRGFLDVHAGLPQRLAEACIQTGVSRLLHMSALNAGSGPSHYLHSKGEGENRVHALADQGLRVTSFQPSVIFGRGDSFFNRFAALLKLTPGLFPLACAGARFAPIWVSDVAEAFARSLDEPSSFGQRYPLCGPRTYSLKQLVQYTADTAGLRRRVIGLPDALARLQALVLERVPGKPFSLDNYRSLQVDSVCHDNGLERFGIEATPLEAVVPTYLRPPV